MPAEYGHATAGALIVVKKAGTNVLHGEGGELFKDNPMYERRFFQLQTNPQQGINDLFQQPDFVVSGPVWIPHVYNGKNKTFFEVAGSYHVDGSSNASSYTTPTTAMLAGNFSAYSNPIYDPATTSGNFAAGNLSRNSLPRQHHSRRAGSAPCGMPSRPTIRSPRPTAPAASSDTGPSGNIVSSGTGNYYNLTTQFRLDHSFTDKFKMFASYTWGNQHQPAEQRQHSLQAVRSVPGN